MYITFHVLYNYYVHTYLLLNAQLIHKVSCGLKVIKYYCRQYLANKQKRLASLDQIVADVKQQKERHQESTTPEITLPYQHHYLHSATNSLSQHGATNTVDDGFSVGTSTSSVAGPPVFNFDDDSDLDSPTGYV